MAGITSLDAVKRKIKSLQDQADQAEERAEQIQKELLAERKAREQVSMNDLWPCATAGNIERHVFSLCNQIHCTVKMLLDFSSLVSDSVLSFSCPHTALFP